MKAEDDRPMSCTSPIDAALLADYWLGAISEDDQERIEEHLLACDACGDGLREVMALAEGIRKLAREGSLRIIVSDAFLRRAEQDGLRVREYAPPAGGGVQCTVTAADDILIGRLAVSLKGARRVDLAIFDENGTEQLRLPDIPVNPGAADVIYQESMTFAKAAPTMKMILRLFDHNEAGADRLLGEYTFNHTRSLPIPGTP